MKAPTTLFYHLNQYADPSHRYGCTIYSCAINLYYNTGIKVTEQEIDYLIDEAIRIKILNVKKGGSLKVLFNFFYDYVVNKYPQVKKDSFLSSNPKYVEYLNKGYMMRVGINVNKDFLYDSQDNGIIDSDYSKLKGTIGHATNVLKWMKQGEEFGKHYVWDSYFGKNEYNLFSVDLGKMRTTIQMPTVYLFYID